MMSGGLFEASGCGVVIDTQRVSPEMKGQVKAFKSRKVGRVIHKLQLQGNTKMIQTHSWNASVFDTVPMLCGMLP